MIRGFSACAIAFTVGIALPARADDATAEALARYERATTAFALGHFAESAAEYERAYQLKPDPALLFDAAQAYRKAGNRARALTLYRTSLGLYPDHVEHRAYVESQVTSLKAELAVEDAAKKA